jgi:hypothetical protein
LKKLPKNLQLTLSAIVVVLAALVYGANPAKILPLIFDFQVDNLELKNIFRAVMGLYLAFAAYWVWGIRSPAHWRSATLSNILFMGGLGAGRLISMFLDGVSPQYTLGMILELLMMGWGIYNLKHEKELL